MPLTSFTANNTARASEVNANFALCVLTDTARTVTVTHTYSATQTFTGGFTTGAAVTLGGNLLFTDATHDIGASGATRPRDLFLSRNAVVGGTLGVTGAVTLSSTLAAGNTTVTGTLAVTSTINSQTISAAANFTGTVSVASTLICNGNPGGTEGFRTAGGARFGDTVTIVSGGLTVTAGGVTSTTGTFSGAVSMTALTATTGAFSGDVQIAGGATISKCLTATTSWDPGDAITDHQRVTTTVNVPGAAVGDLVMVAPDDAGTAATTGIITGRVSATDTVELAFWDQTIDSLGLNPTATDIRIWVVRFA